MFLHQLYPLCEFTNWLFRFLFFIDYDHPPQDTSQHLLQAKGVWATGLKNLNPPLCVMWLSFVHPTHCVFYTLVESTIILSLFVIRINGNLVFLMLRNIEACVCQVASYKESAVRPSNRQTAKNAWHPRRLNSRHLQKYIEFNGRHCRFCVDQKARISTTHSIWVV